MAIYLKDGASAILGMKLSKRKDLTPFSFSKNSILHLDITSLIMKKNILYIIIFLQTLCFCNLFAQQCDSWYNPYSGQQNPINMSLLFSEEYISSIGSTESFPSIDDFTTPLNTGSNATFGIQSYLDDYDGGVVAAFIDDSDGGYICVGNEIITPGFFALALWGDDTETPEKDGLASGEIPIFAILYEGEVIIIDFDSIQFTVPFIGFSVNGLSVSIGASNYINASYPTIALTENNLIVGSEFLSNALNGSLSLKIYSDDTWTDEIDGAVSNEPINLYLVEGNQIFDISTPVNFQEGGMLSFQSATDLTLYCEATEPFGCTDQTAYNYDESANTDDGSCIAYVAGCTDELACNYNSNANSDDSSCLSPSGCETCSGAQDGTGTVVDNDSDDDTYCNGTDAFPMMHLSGSIQTAME